MRTDPDTPVVRAFRDLTEEERGRAGGKGGVLARLYQERYPVPEGFVILTNAFIGGEMTPMAWTQVHALLTALRRDDLTVAFAVRSSAIAEDSPRASFAGEFETVLNARSDEEVKAAIDTVRRSMYSERVRIYSEARGIPSVHEMAVVVQRMVRADISGVLFTADPATGSRDHMVGNYIHGLGDRLVSGESEASSFTLERPSGRYNGSSEVKPFARRLFELAHRLERGLGSPQDVEWAISAGKLYILQSRPITTLIGWDPVTGESNDSLTGDFVWSAVNIGEAMSVVMTPLTSSIMRMAFDEMNVVAGYASVGNIGGRLYQNVTVMMSMMRALRQNVDDIVIEMGGVREEYRERMGQYVVPLRGVSAFSILPRAFLMMRKQRESLKRLAAFVATNPGWCREALRRVPAMQSAEELTLFFKDEFLPRGLTSFWMVVASAWRYGELIAPLRRRLTALVGSADADTLLSNVSSDDELLESLGPVMGLAKVARGEMSREVYLERWGHRGALEGELSAPRPAEDPGWLDHQLAESAQSPVDAEDLVAAKRAEFDATWKEFTVRHPQKAKRMARRLEAAAAAGRAREAIRSESIRLFWVGRAWVMRAGQLAGIGDGAFFLTVHELLDLLEGKDAAVAHIQARQDTYKRYKALPPYPLVIRGRFDPVQWAADPNRSSRFYDSHGLLVRLFGELSDANVIVGVPGSAGTVEGAVRRLDSPEDGDKLVKGEILVTSQANIGWTLLFPKAAAIVTDVGAPLSHAAIVARELGIPAVVNCGDATTRLHAGDRVRVNGVQGVVEILDSGA